MYQRHRLGWVWTRNCLDSAQVETFFRSQEVSHRQTTTLGKASVITFACSGRVSAAASSNVDVDVVVHFPTKIWLATLESWLYPALQPQIVKFEWSAVRTGLGKPYMRDPTVQKFLEETALGLPMPGKRPRVDLAGPSGVSPIKRPGQAGLGGGSHGRRCRQTGRCRRTLPLDFFSRGHFSPNPPSTFLQTRYNFPLNPKP